MKRLLAVVLLIGLVWLGYSYADQSMLTPMADFGPNPVLPAPRSSWIPFVKIAKAVGWPQGATPRPAPGLSVKAFARGLNHPRWVYVLPNGDVLVAETNAPARSGDNKGIIGFIAKQVQSNAGAIGQSTNRILLFRDANGDGVPETTSVFVDQLNAPFGMTLIGSTFYVASADAVLKFPYQDGDTSIKAAPIKVADLPGGPINHHWTKNLIADADGHRLYVAVGSNSNIAENGFDAEQNRAAILELNLATGSQRVYASGLRNPVGMAFHPQTGALWTVVNERDELGSDLVPDYLTSVKDGAFYGWPYSYYGQHVDARVKPQNPDLVAKAIAPDYALGNHTAPLGLCFASGTLLPEKFRNGAFVGQHGSWNRKPLSGYKVIFVPFTDGKPSGMPVDVLTGFLSPKEDAYGRPVGVAIDKAGALLIADDVGNAIWRVTAAP